jgi:hypothetical protein
MQRSTAGRGVIVIGFIKGRPSGIVAVLEGTTGDVEFVGHDELIFRAVYEGGGCVEGFGGVFVDPGAFCRVEEEKGEENPHG